MKVQRCRIGSFGRCVFTTLRGITAKTARPWASFPVRLTITITMEGVMETRYNTNGSFVFNGGLVY